MLFRSDGISSHILTLCARNGEGSSTEVIPYRSSTMPQAHHPNVLLYQQHNVGSTHEVVQLSNLAPDETRAKPCRRSSVELCWLKAMTS
jgi:hypothetical protein